MITDDERFIKIQGILAFSDIHPNDCIKINDLIIDLSKQKEHLQSVIDKAINLVENNKNKTMYSITGEDIDFEIFLDESDIEELQEILRSKDE